MAVFPTLSIVPSWPIEVEDEDILIKSEKAAGYIHKRPRWTKARKNFKLTYKYMPMADFLLLKEFYELVSKTGEWFYYRDFVEAGYPNLAWQASHVYVAGDIIHPTPVNDHSYLCIQGGTSSTEFLGWPTVEKAIATDNTVIWKENSYTVAFGDAPEYRYENSNLVNVSFVLEEK